MAIYIKDITIESDPYGRYRVKYKDKAVILERYVFNQLYDMNDHVQIYKFLVQNFFHEKPEMMYDEYFGTDSYELDLETERIKKLKAEKFESGILGEKGTNQTQSPKELSRKNLNSTFWGSMIIQDIIDANS
ncbi:hypothetical protein GAP32_184 [Cronobacter phage vB_CsaM_GAP32]|uniref:Uncharacterized protein n=1 Tax=Cronobacter phage vB_CsaM_GAP32 TaxID=1141136 RepID=K4FB31_9CAUD|nr:hypothetical protein GAP32_184 [Cronobacter phage vB_CsaM_GAP32]AFC21634.1 hypothetical protein GAP32_184 [Cronobacter phage vB_CsaM_GAP32]